MPERVDKDRLKRWEANALPVESAERLKALSDPPGSDSDMLKAAGYVLQEAVEELLKTWHLDEYRNVSDEMLEVQMEQGYAPEIQDEAKAVLLARSALRMTGYLFPQNADAHPTEGASPKVG